MSKRPPSVSVLTANRLTDGIAVFLAADGRWVERVEGAAIARSAEATQALQAQGARDVARNVVVEPYLAEVAAEGARPVLARTRERVRVEGPSVLGDVPGYVPPSPRSRGEGQPHAPASASVAARHPSPLPASRDRVSISPISSPEAA